MLDPKLEQAASIVERLQEWFEDRDGLSVIRECHLSWSRGLLEIFVGEVLVYSTEDGGPMTFEACRNEFLRHVRAFDPFKDERITPEPDEDDRERCPACNSPDPKLHPAVQHEGEVHVCSDSFHTPSPA